MTLDHDSQHAPHLLRGLGLVPATALIVTAVIGTGVFLKARVMTCNAGTPGMVLLAYVVGGLFTLAGALTFSELGTLMPRAGGQYNFIGAAFGRAWAFLYGWMETFIDGAGSMAAIAIGFVIFFNGMLGGVLSAAEASLLTVATLVLVTLLNLASARTNGVLATVVTVMKIALLIGIAVLAFVFGDGAWSHYGGSGAGGVCEGVPPEARLGIAGFGAAVIGALWSYNGWTMVTMVAEEVKDPIRNLPRALLAASFILVAVYVLVNAAYFYVLSPEEVASVPETSSVADEMMVRILGAGASTLMAAGLMLSSFGALHSTTFAVARVPFAMARDGLLPRSLARVTPHSHIPRNAVLLLGVTAIGISLSGSYDLITDLIVFVLLLFNGMSVAAVFILRRRLPDAPRPYRVWGYPVLPGVFLLGTVALMLNTLIATPGRALAGLGMVALGLPVYAYYARRLPPDKAEDWIGEQHA